MVIVTVVAVAVADEEMEDRMDEFNEKLFIMLSSCAEKSEEKGGDEKEKDENERKCNAREVVKIKPHEKPEFKDEYDKCLDGVCSQVDSEFEKFEANKTRPRPTEYFDKYAEFHLCLRDCVCGKDLHKCPETETKAITDNKEEEKE